VKAGLPEQEWNFDDVSESELAACWLWEYARESQSFARSSAYNDLAISALERGELPPPSNDPEYRTFLAAFWGCDEGWLELYETIRNYGGPAAPAWQQLPEALKNIAVDQVGRRRSYGPLEPPLLQDLEALWRFNSQPWEEAKLKPGYKPEEDELGLEESGLYIAGPEQRGEAHGRTLAAFAIDFRRYDDRAIVQAFRSWLKENRPGDCPEPSQRGRKRRDIRVALDRLGMMRLLHRFTLRQMRDYCPEAWKAFEGYDWYKERKRARMTFRRLFPFLPATENPLSWPTKGGRSK
jgi:hypothetical protein